MGPLLLAGAAVLALIGAVQVLAGRDGTVAVRFAVASVWGAVLFAFVLLIRVDTSYELVASSTRPGLGAARRMMGLWGGSAGSLLLFTAVVGTTLASTRPVDRIRRLAAPVVLLPLTAASLFVARPFEQLAVPAIEGVGLSPILEHWAMLIHPPILYLGFGLALRPALLPGERAVLAARAALTALTAALALGGRWAWTELGWGGWWAWDPVENAALIPWLLLVITLHVGGRHPLGRWSALLCWPAVFAGTAMTRTSLRTSVHAFADADGLGWFLWPLVVVVGAGALALGRRHGADEIVVPRRLLPAALAWAAALIVAAATFRPFLSGVTIGSFYSRWLWPIAMVAAIAAGAAPAAGRVRTRRLVDAAAIGGVLGAGFVIAAGWLEWWQIVNGAALGAGALTMLFHPQPRRTLGHVGFLLVLVGALGATASVQQTIRFEPDGTRTVLGHTIGLASVQLVEDDPPVIRADVLVDGAVLQPELTIHADRGLRLPELASLGNPLEEVQLVLRSADENGSAVITVNVEPLAGAVWVGAILVAISTVPRVQRRL